MSQKRISGERHERESSQHHRTPSPAPPKPSREQSDQEDEEVQEDTSVLASQEQDGTLSVRDLANGRFRQETADIMTLCDQAEELLREMRFVHAAEMQCFLDSETAIITDAVCNEDIATLVPEERQQELNSKAVTVSKHFEHKYRSPRSLDNQRKDFMMKAVEAQESVDSILTQMQQLHKASKALLMEIQDGNSKDARVKYMTQVHPHYMSLYDLLMGKAEQWYLDTIISQYLTTAIKNVRNNKNKQSVDKHLDAFEYDGSSDDEDEEDEEDEEEDSSDDE